MIEKKLDTRIISSYLERFSLPATGAVPARALALETFFRKYSPKAEQCQCDECKGLSDARLAQCPFCGGSAATGEQVEADEVAAVAELIAASGAGVQAKDAAANALIRPVVEEAMADVEDDGNDLDIISDDLSPEQYEAKLRDAGMEIPAKATEHDLDVAVAAIRVEHRNSMMSTYSVGAWLLKVKGLRLWLLRKKKKNRNSPEYTSWAQFVVAETNMTPRHVNRLMATVFMYSRLQFETAGLKTLYLLIGIQDPVKRQELADLASRKELTAAQAREQVHLLSEGRPITRDVAIPGKGTFKGKATIDAKRAAAEKPAVRAPVEEETKPKGKNRTAPPPSIITMQVALGRTEIPLFARGAKGAERRPAKRLADDPHGELIVANGVVMRVSVQVRKTGAKAGQLKLVVDVARPEDLSHGG